MLLHAPDGYCLSVSRSLGPPRKCTDGGREYREPGGGGGHGDKEPAFPRPHDFEGTVS